MGMGFTLALDTGKVDRRTAEGRPRNRTSAPRRHSLGEWRDEAGEPLDGGIPEFAAGRFVISGGRGYRRIDDQQSVSQ
jgi:hypothetical protein